MTAEKILEDLYKQSLKKKFKSQVKDGRIQILIKNINSNKSLVTAIVTCCLEKIVHPEQDIRLHRVDFENGFSARSLDTKITTPFFKRHFPKYANKETSFLTLALRERTAWKIEEANNLKIRNQELKTAFLSILNDINSHTISSKDFIIALFIELYNLSESDNLVFSAIENSTSGSININKTIDFLSKHFSMKKSSRLPVIAVYAVYMELFKTQKRYEDKILKPLNVHTSSDKHSFGDIEIYTKEEQPFEIIEIKHKIPIDKYMIFDIYKKIENADIERYYILTTYHNSFASEDEQNEVNEILLNIYRTKNIDIIANGIIPSIKYYLRMVDDLDSFLSNYYYCLVQDSKLSTEVTTAHIEKWKEIINK